MSRPRERGVALLAAVTTLAALTALALGFASTAIVDQHLTRNAVAAAQADALLRSALAAATTLLGDVAATGVPDTLDAAWAQPTGRQPLGAGWVSARVTDEARRLDLNAAPLRPALPRLLAGLGLDPGLADAVADWTDADQAPRPRGAERDWYLGRTPSLLPRDGPLGSVGELAHVRGVDATALARLRPFVTVAGERAVNPNTASPEVLLAVVGDGRVVERILTARAHGPLDDAAIDVLADDFPDGTRALLMPRGQRYGVRAVAAVGDLRRGVEATVWVPAGLPPAVVAWRPFVPDPEEQG